MKLCCLDFMKRKEVKHIADRVGGKNRSAARGMEKSKGGGGSGVDVGWNNLTRGCLLVHRNATHTRCKRFSSCLQLV